MLPLINLWLPACVAILMGVALVRHARERSWGRVERRLGLTAVRFELMLWWVVAVLCTSVALDWFTWVHRLLFCACLFVGFPVTVGLALWSVHWPTGRCRSRLLLGTSAAAIAYWILFGAKRVEWAPDVFVAHDEFAFELDDLRLAVFVTAILILGATRGRCRNAWRGEIRCWYFAVLMGWGVATIELSFWRLMRAGYGLNRDDPTPLLSALVWAPIFVGFTAAVAASIWSFQRPALVPGRFQCVLWGYWGSLFLSPFGVWLIT